MLEQRGRIVALRVLLEWNAQVGYDRFVLGLGCGREMYGLMCLFFTDMPPKASREETEARMKELNK